MYRKIIAFILISLALIPLFASKNDGFKHVWTWSHDDPNVKYYRYQLDSEDPDKWIIVEKNVMTKTAEGLDPSVEHTLYVQSSYDGKNWSESARATSVEVNESESVNATQIVVPENTSSSYKNNVLLYIGATGNYGTKFGVFPRLGIAYEMQNLFHKGIFSLGARIDYSFLIEPFELDWSLVSDHLLWYDNTIDAKIMMYLLNLNFDSYLGFGVGYSLLNPALKSNVSAQFGHSLGNVGMFSSAWLLSMNLGARWHITKIFTLGGEIGIRYLMPGKDNKFDVSAGLTLGLSF